jgi:DNA-directed RNA polymerase sigma subunit (sigma70/sigma32)
VKKYFGLDGDEPLTMKDIGMIYELTGSRIEQLLKEALGKMRKRNPALREINTD